MKKILPVFLALICLLTIPAFAAPGKLTATPAVSGDQVTVTVKLQNPGIIAMRFFVRYDSNVLRLEKAENGEVFAQSKATFSKEISNNPYTMLWEDSLRTDNVTQSGTLCTLTFAILSGTPSGETTVSIALDQASTFDVNLNDVKVDECSCTVSVPKTQAAQTSATKAAAQPTTAKTAQAVQAPTPAATTSAAKTTAARQPAKAANAGTTKAVITAKTPAGTTGTSAKVTNAAEPKPAPSASAGTSSAAQSPAESPATTAKTEADRGKASAETAAQAQPDATEAAAEEAAADGTVSAVLFAETETAAVPESEAAPDAQKSGSARNLLWLLVLIPIAAVVIVVLRKKK